MRRLLQLVMALFGAMGLFGSSTAGALVLRGIAASDEGIEKVDSEASPGGAGTEDAATPSAGDTPAAGMDETAEPAAESGEDPADAVEAGAVLSGETEFISPDGWVSTGHNSADDIASRFASGVESPDLAEVLEPATGLGIASSASGLSVLNPVLLKFAALMTIDPATLVKSDGGSVPDGGSPDETPDGGPDVVDPVDETPDQ
ncbi:hypothetical protein, partial [Rhodovulum kholense]